MFSRLHLLVSGNQNSPHGQIPSGLSPRQQQQQMQICTREAQLIGLAAGQTIAYLAKWMTRSCSLQAEIDRLKSLT